MVRAQVTGAIDFERFDPNDKWWWRKLTFILKELDTQDSKDIAKINHHHWTAMATVPDLDPEQWEEAKLNASEYLAEVTGLYYPWMKEELSERRNSRDDAVEEFREIWGYPGEPQYEQMLLDNAETWRKIKSGWRAQGNLQEGE